MNKQRKVLITTTYNEMGIIIDTKVEEVAQPEIIYCKECGHRDDYGCCKDLDESIEAAKSRHIRPEIANTSEGPVVRKMVPLDDLKRCADLCIDMGWTLQEFRKNMNEWDEDTVDITETE